MFFFFYNLKNKIINEKIFKVIEKIDNIEQNSNCPVDDGFIFELDDKKEEMTSDEDLMPINRTAQKKAMIDEDEMYVNDI